MQLCHLIHPPSSVFKPTGCIDVAGMIAHPVLRNIKICVVIESLPAKFKVLVSPHKGVKNRPSGQEQVLTSIRLIARDEHTKSVSDKEQESQAAILS